MRARESVSITALVLVAGCGGGGHPREEQHEGTTSGASATPHGDAGAATDAATSSAASTDASAATGDNSDAGFLPPPSGPQAQQLATLYGTATQAYEHGDFPTAAHAFRQAYDLYPAPATAYNAARTLERMGEVNDAIHYYEIVRTGHPAPSPEQVADIDRREAALRAYDARRREGIAQTMPSNDALSAEGNTWFQRGVTFYRRHQFQQALLAFEQAYNYLQTPELFFNLAVTHEHLHNIDRALEFMREYLQARLGTPEESYIRERIQQLEAQQH